MCLGWTPNRLCHLRENCLFGRFLEVLCQAAWVAYVDKEQSKLFSKSKNLIKCFGINKNRCFDCKDERICYADQVFQTPDNFWTKTKDGCECKWKVRLLVKNFRCVDIIFFRKKTMVQNAHAVTQEGNSVKLIKQETSVLDRKTVKICVMLIKNIKLLVRLSKYTVGSNRFSLYYL